jgi:hypothetical protein
MYAIEEDITKVSEVVHHNSEVVDVVNIKTFNLISAEGDTKMQPGVGTRPIKIEAEKTKHLKAHN